MKYVERENWVEHYPESERDLKLLRDHYGARGLFDHWCVAKMPEELRESVVRRHWDFVPHGLRNPVEDTRFER